MKLNVVRAIFALCAIVLFAGRSFADGLIIVENHNPVPGHFPFAPLEVRYHRVSVDIDDRVAVTSVDQEFYNPSGARLEGKYLFPLPAGAHIDKFSMDINGKQMEAELLPADKARSMYEEIVRKMRDPALLEYSGRDAFRVRIFPIEPNSTKHIKIRYTQILKEDSDLVEYSYPLNTEKFSSRPINDVSVIVKVRSPQALKNIYCSSHNVEVRRDGASAATISYEERNARPDTDFKLMFSRQKSDVGIKLLSYKRPGADEGYFMLMASPGSDLAQSKIAAKDIVFVLDTSGSMADRNKLDQAKKALNFCLSNLNEEDRFNIVRFSSEAETLLAELEHPTSERIERAKSFVNDLKPRGRTAIDDALAAALRCRQSDSDSLARPFMIVFLTDGAPTVGVTDEDQIVKRATDRAADVRIFCFGIGHDVNTHLLDRVADATRAASTYVLPDEDIELKVSSFYDKVKEPVLTNVRVALNGEEIRATQLYPAALPDLFKGDTLLLFGRYSGSGPASVKLSGALSGKLREFVEDVRFTADDTSQAFIPTMWATRRVGWLLDEIRQHGESTELKDEVVRLSREHGIVTPYTVYLIMEDEGRRNVPVAQRSFREMESDASVAGSARGAYDSAAAEAAAPAMRAGKQAVANAQAYQRLKYGTNMQAAQSLDGLNKLGAVTTQPAGYRDAQNYAQQVRLVNGRAFYQNGNTWTDATAQANAKVRQKQVKFGGDEYFDLLRAHPDASQWLALGNNVDLVLDDTLYSIRDN